MTFNSWKRYTISDWTLSTLNISESIYKKRCCLTWPCWGGCRTVSRWCLFRGWPWQPCRGLGGSRWNPRRWISPRRWSGRQCHHLVGDKDICKKPALKPVSLYKLYVLAANMWLHHIWLCLCQLLLWLFVNNYQKRYTAYFTNFKLGIYSLFKKNKYFFNENRSVLR